MSIYSFRGGPQYRAVGRGEQFLEALDQPLGIGATIADQFVGGMNESYGLGTAIKDATVPQGNVDMSMGWSDYTLPGFIYNTGRRLRSMVEPESPSLSEEDYKQSPYYRERIPWDSAMTEDRAAALAIMDDRRSVREYYAQKRPISAFFGNLAGQAMDPINYIPIAGPGVRAAAIAKAGRYGGRAVVAAGDAAANTALFGLATANERGRYGDDVSWEALTSEIASAALIGSVFGTVSGVFSARADAKVNNALLKLKEVQEARVALNEAVSAVSHGDDVALSPTATGFIKRKSEATSVGVRDIDIGDFYAQPHRTVDELYNVAQKWQDEFATSAKTIADDLGVEHINPGVKERKTAQEKIVRKGYQGPESLTDVVRSGFTVDTIEKAEAVVSRLAALYDVLDEGWKEKPDGYFDRKVLIRFPDGTIGEVQLWEPNLLKAKEGRGHELYQKERGLEYGSEEAKKLRAEMQQLYAEARNKAGQAWSGLGGLSEPNLLKRSRQADSSSVPAEWNTSQASTSTQPELGSSIASALDSPRTAGRFSQSTNVIEEVSVSKSIDTSTGRADPPPEGRADAEKTVGKPDDMRALAEQHGVDLATGDFVESADIEMMRSMGRLTEEDEAVLAAADESFQSAEAYGESMKAALFCVA